MLLTSHPSSVLPRPLAAGRLRRGRSLVTDLPVASLLPALSVSVLGVEEICSFCGLQSGESGGLREKGLEDPSWV